MNRDDLLRAEQKSIERSHDGGLKKWQVQCAYYLAMLNNNAINGKITGPIIIQLVPGENPKLKQVQRKKK